MQDALHVLLFTIQNLKPQNKYYGKCMHYFRDLFQQIKANIPKLS